MSNEKKAIACQLADILSKNLSVFSEKRAQNLCQLFESSSKEAFDEFIVEEGFVEKDDLLKALSIYYDLPMFDARGYYFDHHLVRMFPKDEMIRGGFIPVSMDEPTLIIAAANPNDPILAEAIGKFVSYDITFFVGIRQDIVDGVEEFYDLSLTQTEEFPIEELEEEHEAKDFENLMYGEEEEK